MANVRNYEEYRAEVLDTLGATVEDLRNEPSFRAKVLETLGVEFTDEDTRNFERYRLKALEGLKNGGGSGGGGSSDFSTANVSYPNGMPRALPLAMLIDDEIQTVSSNTAIPTGTYTFVLYKGKVFLHDFDADYLNQDGFSTSGNITYDTEDKQYVITGDFTVAAPQL